MSICGVAEGVAAQGELRCTAELPCGRDETCGGPTASPEQLETLFDARTGIMTIQRGKLGFPVHVLSMTTTEVNSRGYRYPRLVAGCTGCKACSQICPDAVFQVWKYDEPMRNRADTRSGLSG